MKTSKIFTAVFLIILLFTNVKNVYCYTPEVKIHIYGTGTNCIVERVTVYKYDSNTRNYIYVDSGLSLSTPDYNGFNAAFNIGKSDVPNPTISWLAGGPTYCIRISDSYYKIVYSGAGAYGDMEFTYQNGAFSGGSKTFNCGYVINGPYTWSDKTITLKNDFGSDRNSCFGTIYLNSDSLTNVGYSGTPQTREAQTFPHTVSGKKNQLVNYYYRKWRNWENGITAISKIVSDISGQLIFDITATYAKQVNATLTNDFGGGNINVNSTAYSSGSIVYLYDDNSYTITAPSQTFNGVNYVFDHWSGAYNNTQNPLFYNPPSSTINLTAYYIGTASASPMNIHFTSSNGENVRIAWTEHPDNGVTQYQVWRSVTGGSTGSIATLNRGTTSFTDYQYVQNPSGATKLFYTVKAYYAPSDTWNDPGYILNRGDGTPQPSIANNNNNQLNELGKELPAEYSIGNYPNPFNPTTTIDYQLPENGFVTIKVYDVLGKEVATLVNENKSAGYYKVDFDASRLTSGVYIYTITANNFTLSKKVLLMK